MFFSSKEYNLEQIICSSSPPKTTWFGSGSYRSLSRSMWSPLLTFEGRITLQGSPGFTTEPTAFFLKLPCVLFLMEFTWSKTLYLVLKRMLLSRSLWPIKKIGRCYFRLYASSGIYCWRFGFHGFTLTPSHFHFGISALLLAGSWPRFTLKSLLSAMALRLLGNFLGFHWFWTGLTLLEIIRADLPTTLANHI